jgi:hypothetical protein
MQKTGNQIRNTLLGLLAATAVFGATLHGNAAAGEQHFRIVTRLPIESNEPVTITKLALNGERIVANEKFLADDDWLEQLRLTVKNSSNKAIRFASIQLQFPRPAGFNDSFAIDDVSYGNGALVSHPTLPDTKSEFLAPDQETNIQLSPSDSSRITRLLALNGYKGRIENVAIRVGSIIFADDTMWHAGSLLRRDQSVPSNWIAIDPE